MCRCNARSRYRLFSGPRRCRWRVSRSSIQVLTFDFWWPLLVTARLKDNGRVLTNAATKTLHRVGAAARRAAATSPVGVEKFAARLVRPLVSVRAEVIALCLQQICRQNGAAVLIVKRERGAERRNRNAFLRRRCHNVAPAFLRLLDFAPEIIIQQQV